MARFNALNRAISLLRHLFFNYLLIDYVRNTYWRF